MYSPRGRPAAWVQAFASQKRAALAVSVADSLLSLMTFVLLPSIAVAVASFDASLFNISASEAALLDPQQRLMLECALEVVTSPAGVAGTAAGDAASRLAPPPLPGKSKLFGGSAGAAAGSPTAAGTNDTGVFVGASYAEWVSLLHQQQQHQSTYTASGSGLSVIAGGSFITSTAQTGCFHVCATVGCFEHLGLPPPGAGRIAFLFGFSGPATVTDTACSSSLVALASAHNALMLGVCKSAIRWAWNTGRCIACT